MDSAKPSILHRARRAANGGATHDDAIIRARLAQAFGRLIRSKDDRGHFVVLSSAFPTRLLTAFPKGTPVVRCTLDEALQRLGAKSPSLTGEGLGWGMSQFPATIPTPSPSPGSEADPEGQREGRRGPK